MTVRGKSGIHSFFWKGCVISGSPNSRVIREPFQSQQRLKDTRTLVERLRDQEGLVASPGREYCKRVSVNFLTQIAQTLHRPAVASFVLVLLESRRRIGGENTEIYKTP